MHAVLMRAIASAVCVAAALLVLAHCSQPQQQPPPQARQERSSTPPPQKPSAAAAAAVSKVNLDEIFPKGRGRELVLNNCTTCHTFVPIVILRMTREAWARNSRDHRGRVEALPDADFKVLYEYLAANFGPDKPVPRLPNELMETWTSY